MPSFKKALATGLVALAISAPASATTGASTGVLHHGDRYRAVIICGQFPQEDSLGETRLVEYGPTHGRALAIFRCTKNGR
jgi:hypothetical protein